MGVITTPSLLQVTVVAGPPVEVQVRVLDWSSKVKLITVGEPAVDVVTCCKVKLVTISHRHKSITTSVLTSQLPQINCHETNSQNAYLDYTDNFTLIYTMALQDSTQLQLRRQVCQLNHQSVYYCNKMSEQLIGLEKPSLSNSSLIHINYS